MITSDDAAIWARLLDPASPLIDEYAAAGFLQLKFQRCDVDRMNMLAEKGRQAALSEAERREIESYNRVGHLVAIVQARATQILQQRQPRN